MLYWYSVKAYNSSGDSGFYADTSDFPSTPDGYAPAPAMYLQVPVISEVINGAFSAPDGTVILRWKQVAGAEEYDIQRRDITAKGDWITISTAVDATDTGFWDTMPDGTVYMVYSLDTDDPVPYDPNNPHKYAYRVRARETTGPSETEWSNEMTNTYYPPVEPLTAVAETVKAGTQIKWKKLTGINNYRIYRALWTSSPDFQVVAKSVSGTVWTDKWSKKNAIDGAIYLYRIVGLVGGKEVTLLDISDGNFTANAYLLTPTVKSVTVGSVDDQVSGTVGFNDMVITFNKVKGATDYVLWEKAPLSATKVDKVWTATTEPYTYLDDLEPSNPTGLARIVVSYGHPTWSIDSKQKFTFAVQAKNSSFESYPIDQLKPGGKSMTHWEVNASSDLQPTVSLVKSNKYGDVLKIEWTKYSPATRYVIYREDPYQPGSWKLVGGYNWSSKGITLTSTSKVQYLDGDSFRIAIASGKTPLSSVGDVN